MSIYNYKLELAQWGNDAEIAVHLFNKGIFDLKNLIEQGLDEGIHFCSVVADSLTLVDQLDQPGVTYRQIFSRPEDINLDTINFGRQYREKIQEEGEDSVKVVEQTKAIKNQLEIILKKVKNGGASKIEESQFKNISDYFLKHTSLILKNENSHLYKMWSGI